MKARLSLLLNWQRNSLKVRLVFSALLLIVIVLPVIGIILKNAFEVQIRQSIKNELSAYSYSILAVAEVEQQQMLMPQQLLQNQFNVSKSGLYALISQSSPDPAQPITQQQLQADLGQDALNQTRILWRSQSFLTIDDPQHLPQPLLGQSAFADIELDGKQHLIYSFSVSFSSAQQAFPVTLHIIKDLTDFLQITQTFEQQLWRWLMLLMALLMLVQIIWLIWTLHPLGTLQAELVQIEQGKTSRLKQNYPQELVQVTNQVNALLQSEHNQRQRYVNALADLAHSLKTPLAVMQSQHNLSTTTKQQLLIIDRTISHQLKRAQSAGECSWHASVNVAQSASKLVKTLEKIYHTKQLVITSKIDKQAIFKGDEADLMEILGNLLDNACKAAVKQIQLDVVSSESQLTLVISDDGKGIDQAQRKIILQRGVRADTYQQGHGIGLAIVRDLVASYQGVLTIADAHLLGGASFTVTFSKG
jgi:two-component system sensor histidine kinase PhoQ